MTPIVEGVLETSLYVDDLERSSAFYTSLFGFEVMVADARLHALAVPGKHVLLLFRKRASLTMDTPHDGDGQLHVAFSIAKDALPAWESRLNELAIPIESRVTWPRGGQSIYFRDPEQHLLELVTPGCWDNY
jgi:catechol 2,3-dioxygenase-like lactoylglutathione lyase family enzyme